MRDWVERINWRSVARESSVPLLFLSIAVGEFFLAGLSWQYVATEVLTRVARDSLLAVALVVPIVAGLGLNFSVVVGALAGQIGLLIANDLGIAGLPGLAFAVVFGVILGWIGGRVVSWCLQRAPGREMIVGIVLGFLADGVYRIVFMAGYGPVLPSHNAEMLLSRGIGLRDTIDMAIMRRSLDTALPLRLGPLTFPVATLVVLALVAWLVWRLLRSRIGRHMTAIGLDSKAAEDAGLNVVRLRRWAIVISTIIAAIGQVIWVQNIGMLQTYVAHRNVGFLASAALLAGGATVRKARVRNALIGTAVFHAMFLLSPLAGQELTGSPAIGEYFRSFITYGTICIALVLTGINEARARRERLNALLGEPPAAEEIAAGGRPADAA